MTQAGIRYLFDLGAALLLFAGGANRSLNVQS
jgi:hypothetical protein